MSQILVSLTFVLNSKRYSQGKPEAQWQSFILGAFPHSPLALNFILAFPCIIPTFKKLASNQITS